MRSLPRLRAVAPLPLVLALAACTPLDELPPNAQVSCRSPADCPSGLVCHQSHCVDPDVVDTTPPDLVPGSLALEPARVRADQPFTLALEATEPLAAPPIVTLALLAPVELACAPAAGERWSCSHTVAFADAGLVNGGSGGTVAIDVRMRDRAGNTTVRSGVASVTFDFAPPEATVASVSYVPGADNPLPTVAAAMAGTVVRVAVSADEALGPAPAPSLVARHAGVELPFTLVSAVDNDVVFEATVAAGTPDGAYALEVGWADEVGNEGVAPVAGREVAVKTSRPVLEVDQEALVFVRSPQGNGAAEDLGGGYTVPRGPHFAVEPAATLAGGTTLPAGALRLAGGEVPSRIVVQDAPGDTALVLGTLRPTGGLFPRQPLASPDLATIQLVGVDLAGNRSGAVKLEHAEWVATSNPPATGGSPHALTLLDDGGGPREHAAPGTAALGPESAAVDGDAVVARAALAWRERSALPALANRQGHAMAYDAVRGRVVLFGGFESGGTGSRSTWEWDGVEWRERAITGARPRARWGFAMAFDAARGRTLLFGGEDLLTQDSLGDLWEWDGAAWTELQPAGARPGPRDAHALAYDPARERVVLFGGGHHVMGMALAPLDDTWEWDGAAWAERAPAGARPVARWGAVIAHDTWRGRALLHGGQAGDGSALDDTWEWDGTGWMEVASAGPEAAGAAMAFDADRGRAVLVGATGAWEWDGATWTSVAGPATGSRSGHAMVYDAARERVFLFGGTPAVIPPTGVEPEGWEWDGVRWVEHLAGARPVPPPRAWHAMAHDAARARVVLFAGQGESGWLGDTWEWDGDRWWDVTPAGAGPATRDSHAMAYDAARGRVVLFGGFSDLDGLVQDTWEWDGSTWRDVTPAGGSPPPRDSHAMVFDPSRSRIVLFGGDGAAGPLQDTWEWNGVAWEEIASATAPSPRSTHAMAYDSSRGRVVLFGGRDPDLGALGDTWERAGTEWVHLSPAAGPSPRTRASMAFDARRGRAVLFGGDSPDAPGGYLGDVWEWDGTAWRAVPLRDAAEGASPMARMRSSMVFDAARGSLVVFGGYNDYGGPRYLGDSWELVGRLERTPAVQLDVSALGALSPASIEGLRIRARAGGTFGAGTAAEQGAALLGWSCAAPLAGPGWVELDRNGAGLAGAQPFLPVSTSTVLGWQSTDAAEARRFVTGRDGRLSFQVRPLGPAGAAAAGAPVALDAIEVRVRYTAP